MSKLFKNIIYNILGQGIIFILSFLSVRFIFIKLGGDILGIIYFTIAMSSLLSVIFDLGFSSLVVREISGYFNSDKKYILEFISTFSFLYWIVYFIICIIIYYIAPFIIERWINAESLDKQSVIYMLRIIGIFSALVLPISFYSSILRGLQKIGVVNVIDVLAMIVQQVGIIIFLLFGNSIIFISYIISGSYILRILMYLIACYKKIGNNLIFLKYSKKIVFNNLKFIIGTGLISIFSAFHLQVDKIVISKFLSITELGYYSFAYSGISRGSLISGAISQAAYPSFSNIYINNKEELLKQYNKLQDLICFLTVPIFAFMIFFSTPIISIIFNKDVASLLFFPILLIAIGFYMNGTLSIPYVLSLAIGKPDIMARMNFYAVFFVLPIMVLLVYNFGLVGGSLSFVIYHIFAYFYAIPKICKKCLNIMPLKWYSKILNIFFISILTYGILYFIFIILNKQSLAIIACGYIFSTLFYFALSYFYITDDFKTAIWYNLKLLKKYI